MLTIIGILAIASLIITLVHAIGRCILWPAVLILSIIQLLSVIPLGR
jgi:hypothetical protein